MELFVPKNELSIFPFKTVQVIPYHMQSGVMNMALDYFFAQNMSEAQPPILRFYGWKPYTLSLGFHQSVSLVDVPKVRKSGYDLVRRPTGGSAIFHSEELTYSLILPRASVEHHAVYYLFHKLLAQALNELGFPVELNFAGDSENYLKEGRKRFACFNRPAFAEIKFRNKKVVGSAQKLYRNALLQHGSILIGPKQNEIVEFLRLNEREKEQQKRILRKTAISLSQITPGLLTPQTIAEALLASFEKYLKTQFFYRTLSSYDLEHAQKFVHYFKIK